MKYFKLPYITIAFAGLFQIYYLFSHNILYLLLNVLPDDAFYYFQPARNIINGFDSTFDGVNLANGYHPLWMLVILPIFKMFSVGGLNDIVPIYGSLLLAIIFSSITGIFLYKIFKKFTNDDLIISFGLFIYFFNPYLLFAVLNGLETSLVLMCLSIFIYAFTKFDKKQSKRNLIFIGISGGLLALARLDMVIVVAISNIWLIYKYGFIDFQKSINYFLISGITSFVFFAAWFNYNFQKFGMYFTSASVTSTFINHRLTYSDNGGQSTILFLKTIIYQLERAMSQIIDTTGAGFLVLSLIGIGIYLYFKNFKFTHFKNLNLNIEIFVTIGLLALVFVSAGLRWTFRDWYFIPLLLILSIFLVWIIQKISNEFNKIILLLILTVSFAFSYFISWDKNLENREVLQKTIYEAVLWQNENLPEGSLIGVFNSGIQAYFSKHKVTNLDGLININASNAMLDNTLWQYIIEKEKIDYISDFDSYMTYRYRDSFRDGAGNIIDPTSSSTMEKIHTINGPKDLNIYKIKY